MSPRIAGVICIAFILWMFKRESARKEGHSKGLWIPTIWVTILGSKPLSLWISGQNFGNSSDGSPMDRLLLVGLLVGGLIVLSRRKFSWGSIISSNRWVFLYFAFSGCSVIWSDESAASLKFWVKDAANIIMVAVVLTEENPGEAAKAMLLRCSYILIPCSVLFTKYFPDIGRGYNQWTFQPIVLGVTTDKNALGQTLFVSGMVLCWAFVDWLEKKNCEKKDLVSHGLLGAMILWLLMKANCATALTCSTLGLAVMLGMRWPVIRNAFQRLNFGRLLVFGFILLILFAVVDVQSIFLGVMGRDLTLTGRTDIWARCLKVSINPLLGAGYCNFWWGDREAQVSEGFYYPLNEAHSGYMETYLNLGLMGLGLLFCALGTRLSKVKASIGDAVAYQSPRLGFLLANAVYNVTESAFSGLGVIWFVLLLVLLESPEHVASACMQTTETPATASTAGSAPSPLEPANASA